CTVAMESFSISSVAPRTGSAPVPSIKVPQRTTVVMVGLPQIAAGTAADSLKITRSQIQNRPASEYGTVLSTMGRFGAIATLAAVACMPLLTDPAHHPSRLSDIPPAVDAAPYRAAAPSMEKPRRATNPQGDHT